MKELQGHDVENLLEQVDLVQPPETLDKCIDQLFHGACPIRSVHRRFGFTQLCGAAVVALLVGGLIGFSAAQYNPVMARLSQGVDASALGNMNAASLFTPVVFNKLHGHSNNAEFADCSACHEFANKDQQQLEKWRMDSFHDAEIREQLGVSDCRNCHTGKGDLGPSPHVKQQELD